MIRVRIFGEARVGRTLVEYQEALSDGVTGPPSVYEAAIIAIRGYRDAVREHADSVEPPSALVVVVEPVEAPA